jgi:hypothetical protein
MTKDKHVHDFAPHQSIVPLHNYIIEKGRIIKDLISGKDVLRQYKCKCGVIQTVDLERKIA